MGKFWSNNDDQIHMRHGRQYISYIVLADMVRAVWRLSAEPYKTGLSTE